MFPSKLNVSLKSFDFDEHFKKVSEKFLSTVHYSVSLPPLMQYCETCLWILLHSNKGLSETKFSSCSLIFFLEQKIRRWTLPSSVLCIWQTPQRKLKDNSAFSLSLDRDAYGLYDPLGGRILENLDLEGILILLDSLVTFCCLIQGSNIISSNQKGSLPRKHRRQCETMIPWIILLLRRRLLQHHSKRATQRQLLWQLLFLLSKGF